MKLQALFRLQTTLPRLGIVTIHLAQHLQYIATLIGKVRRNLHELSSSVRKAICQQNLHSRSELRNIARECVTGSKMRYAGTSAD